MIPCEADHLFRLSRSLVGAKRRRCYSFNQVIGLSQVFSLCSIKLEIDGVRGSFVDRARKRPRQIAQAGRSHYDPTCASRKLISLEIKPLFVRNGDVNRRVLGIERCVPIPVAALAENLGYPSRATDGCASDGSN